MFEIINKIGKGSSCYVYKALNKKDQKVYAIKQSLSPENDELLKNEIIVFQKFKNQCQNIVHFYDYFKANNESDQNCLCIQIEYCQYGSIREIIKRGKKSNIFINEIEISSIIYMVLQSLVFIHKLNLVVRDIKGRNILVDKEGNIKLCDFGICKTYHKNNMKHIRGGSPYWMAPEVLKKEEYDQTIDIWALGITCIELAEYEPPYFNLSPKEVMKQIIKSPPNGLNDKSKWSPEFQDFISCCLNVDRFKRATAEELLKHDFITMIDSKNLNRKLVISNFLSKCGYKVLYNRKIKITPIINGNSNNYNRITNHRALYYKKGLDSIKKKNGKMFYSQFHSNNISNTNILSSENCDKKNLSNNKVLRLEKNKNKDEIISLKCSSIFKKKSITKYRGIKQGFDKFENKIKLNNYNILTSLLNKRRNHILNRLTYFGHNKKYLTLENNSLHSVNNISYTNNIDQSSKDRKDNSFKNFLRDKKRENIKGREIEDNFDEKYEFLEEDNNDKEKDKINDEIKKLLEQRDIEINNIMLKYQDKMDKIKKEQNKISRENE